MLRATNHAGITVCNRDRESGFPKCLPLPGDRRSSNDSNFHRPILCHSNPGQVRSVWVPVLPLELLPQWTPIHDFIPRAPLVGKMVGTKSIPRCWHRSFKLYLSVFVFSADLVPAFGFRRDLLFFFWKAVSLITLCREGP
jgi:hypothetical protein